MSEQAQEMIDTRSIDELPLHPKYHSALKELIKIILMLESNLIKKILYRML